VCSAISVIAVTDSLAEEIPSLKCYATPLADTGIPGVVERGNWQRRVQPRSVFQTERARLSRSTITVGRKRFEVQHETAGHVPSVRIIC